jgi:predicted MFS family arabinose efflux permease
MVMLPLVAVHSTLAAAGLFLLGGAVWGPYSAVETSALQRWVTPSRHGAVFGLQRSLLGTAAPLGSAAGALAVQFAPPNGVLAISAGACAAAGLCALSNHDLRRAR